MQHIHILAHKPLFYLYENPNILLGQQVLTAGNNA